ncbi:hypothetical protein [Lentzea sp.]|uniref:hypothetical protein n=1 Tax=Lentzea sp. TaxID=56099 RepID=UPI002ED3642C
MHLAEVELLLTEEVRAYTPADVHIGRIVVHGLQVDHLATDEPHDVFLAQILYDITLEEGVPDPLSVTAGLEFRTPDVRVRDAWPRSVTKPRQGERLAITTRLEFVPHTPDATGLLDDNVPVSEIAPTVHAFGIGGSKIRWHHTGAVLPGPRRGSLIVTAPAACTEIEIRVVAATELPSTLGMHPRDKPDTIIVRLPHRPAPETGLRYRIGFTVDIVGYSSRTSEAQKAAQQRIFTLLRRFAEELGITFDPQNFQGTGDGYHYVLPDVDALVAVRHLVETIPRLLREDNRSHADEIRLRMAADIGPVEQGVLGFGGPTVIRFCRLVDSDPIRAAMKEADTDIAIIVSDTLYNDVLRQYGDLVRLPFQQCTVAVKNYQATAHLLSRVP